MKRDKHDESLAWKNLCEERLPQKCRMMNDDALLLSEGGLNIV